MSRRRYAVVGTGSRAQMYIDALCADFHESAVLVGLCDKNAGRLEHYARRVADKRGTTVPTYVADEDSRGTLDRLIGEQRPEVIVVTTGPDRTHVDYIVAAMRGGCDVITEKPMATNAEDARAILTTRKETGRQIQVTFNYRYAPPRSHVRRLLKEGAVGDVYAVDFAWTLDTRHGADYFRRWHRQRANSGSLLVHKATHHFDLVNWWIDDRPQEVFAHGARRYYTPKHADSLGLTDRGRRCLDCPCASQCPFYIDLRENRGLAKLYLETESHDGYHRDQCVFGEEVDIWDTMSVTVRYRRGALLTYQLHAYSPTEGYRIAFSGEKGRLEHFANENSYMNGDGSVPGELERGKIGITLIPEFERPREIEPRMGSGGHGGGDPELLRDLFATERTTDPLRRHANQVDGVYSILVGVAAAQSIDSGGPIQIEELIGEAPLE